MRIGLIQVDGKLPNLALMKISTFYKSVGAKVEFAKPKVKYNKVFASVLFSWNRMEALRLYDQYPNVEIGGTGFDVCKQLPPEIESCQPDYELYTPELIYHRIRHGIRSKKATVKKALQIASMGAGFTTRGCVRSCDFCVVPKKEGPLRQENTIAALVNPHSTYLTLYDNNLTADPFCLDKLHEIKERNLKVDISQGIDIRLLTDPIARALAQVKHMRSIHFAWDLMSFENQVLHGAEMMLQHIKPWRLMCFVLVGFSTTHEEDMYRVQKLIDMKISRYIMKFNNRKDDIFLNHFARWINGRFYKTCSFEEYTPWLKHKPKPFYMENLFQFHGEEVVM